MSFSRMAAKQSPPWSQDPLREPGGEGLEFQVGPIGGDQLVELVEAELAVDVDGLGLIGVEAVDDELAELRRHRSPRA